MWILAAAALFAMLVARLVDDAPIVRAQAGVSASAGYLAVTNVGLAVFNLIPAAPLDGGRVLRAGVWRSTGDRVRAAQVAAGAAEAQYAVLGRRLHGVLVGDVMTAGPVTAEPDRSVAAFIDEMVLHRPFSSYPLVDSSGRLSGLVTLNRIRAVPAEERASVRLAEIACPPGQVPTAIASEPLVALLPRMSGCADGRAVVVDPADRVVGIVSPRDISRAVSVADLYATHPYPPRGADLNVGPGSSHFTAFIAAACAVICYRRAARLNLLASNNPK